MKTEITFKIIFYKIYDRKRMTYLVEIDEELGFSIFVYLPSIMPIGRRNSGHQSCRSRNRVK